MFGMHHSSSVAHPLPGLAERFGIRSLAQLAGDLGEVVRGTFERERFQLDLSSWKHLRPDLSLPAYAGMVSNDGLAAIMNLFDRVGGGRGYSQRVTRRSGRDFRGHQLTYDQHDGTDIVCPIGTPLCAAAPGVVVLVRDRWLRGGLTVSVDHGGGVVTHYTHCSRAIVSIGAVVERGQPVALSGVSGVDMTTFFPWVPPHVHFMVWVCGRPVDPFLADGEPERAGVWADGNAPRPSGPRPGDVHPMALEVDADAVAELAATCMDSAIQDEIRALAGNPLSVAALIEDSLHHDRYAWPEGVSPMRMRPGGADETVRLTLPLPAEEYRGIHFADTSFTRS